MLLLVSRSRWLRSFWFQVQVVQRMQEVLSMQCVSRKKAEQHVVSEVGAERLMLLLPWLVLLLSWSCHSSAVL